MSVAIRAITRIQDGDDAPALGAGQDGYALTWDNASGAFVATALVTDHGGLSGLSDDDHTGYALLAGRAGGQTLYGGTAANEDITIHGTSDGTRTTSYVLLQPTAGNVGIGTSAPGAALEIVSSSFPPMRVVRTVSSDDLWSAGAFLAKSSANMTDTFGVCFTFQIEDNASVTRSIANVGAYRDGDDTSGAFVVRTYQTIGTPSERMRITSTGRIGIGTTAPATLIHGLLTSAATNAVTNVLTVGHDTSGTAAAGFGAGLLYQLESSTTAAQDAARIQALWYEATHATRKADLVLTAYDTAEREGLRIRGNGSAPAIGFLGATPAARIAHVADPSGGATVDAEARSAINSILATLENFGLHATS